MKQSQEHTSSKHLIYGAFRFGKKKLLPQTTHPSIHGEPHPLDSNPGQLQDRSPHRYTGIK